MAVSLLRRANVTSYVIPRELEFRKYQRSSGLLNRNQDDCLSHIDVKNVQ